MRDEEKDYKNKKIRSNETMAKSTCTEESEKENSTQNYIK